MCLIFYMSGSISWMRIQKESYNFEWKQDWWKEGGWIKRRKQKEGEMSRKKGAGRWSRGAFQWLPLSKEYISNSSIWNFKPESNGKTLLGSALSLPPNEWYQYFAYVCASKCLQLKQPPSLCRDILPAPHGSESTDYKAQALLIQHRPSVPETKPGCSQGHWLVAWTPSPKPSRWPRLCLHTGAPQRIRSVLSSQNSGGNPSNPPGLNMSGWGLGYLKTKMLRSYHNISCNPTTHSRGRTFQNIRV